jgi:tetratricopeptide (TPR) repeat protein
LDPENRDASRALGLILVQAGRVDEAAELLLTWLGSDADEPGNTAEVGAVLQRVEDKRVVLDVLGRMRLARPDVAFLHHAYGVTSLQLGNFEDAVAGSEAALAVKPDWTQAWLLKARALESQDKNDAALEEMEGAVEQFPDDDVLRVAYARLLVGRLENEKARKQIAALADSNPANPEMLYTLGVLSTQMSDLEDAERYLRASVQAGGDQPEIYYEIGRVAELRQDFAEALRWYAQVTEGQRALDAKVRTGFALARLGEIESARELFRALRRDNASLAVRLYLSESDALRESQQMPDAMDLLNLALDEHPGDHDLLYARALVAERMDRMDLLEQDLRLILAEKPDNAHALNALGYSLADRTNRHEEAFGYIKRALELNPEDAAILDSMGWVLYRLGRNDEALKYLEKAYLMNPDQEIAAHLGEVLWVNGDRERAMSIWEDGLQRVKEAPLVRSTMERFGI